MSPDFVWSVGEEVTLDGLLSVRRLYGVSIENYGEFVACSYEAAQQYIRLDGVPASSRCPVRPLSENWFVSAHGRTVCEETEATACRFYYSCTH